MVTKLFLGPNPLPFFNFFPKKPSFPKFLFFSLSSGGVSGTAQTRIPDPKLSYGPSLHKGTNPILPKSQSPLEDIGEEDEYLLNEESFSRVFELSAIRVPSKDCFALESRLRGHLLNWPRIRNIARVPGDEVADELVDLVGNRIEDDENGDGLVSLNRRIYGKGEGDGEKLSPVLYREELVKTFDSRGFVNFRNLARMTRPEKRKKKREEERGEGKKKKSGRSEIAVVEVVEDGERGEDLKALLGEEFVGRKWRGPTRLLLLDERYASRLPEELPEAIKVVLQENNGVNMKPMFDLVRCKLTLFYDYWQMNELGHRSSGSYILIEPFNTKLIKGLFFSVFAAFE